MTKDLPAAPGSKQPKYWRRPLDADRVKVPHGELHILVSPLQGMSVLRRVLPERRARHVRGLQSQGLSLSRRQERSRLRELPAVRDALSGVRHLLPRGRGGGQRMMTADPRGVLTGEHYLDGDHAAAEGALAAGCRFFAGYPITPSTEVAERIAARFPKVGGLFRADGGRARLDGGDPGRRVGGRQVDDRHVRSGVLAHDGEPGAGDHDGGARRSSSTCSAAVPRPGFRRFRRRPT